MLADDIKKVEYYVDFGGPHNKVADARTRIKTALEDSQKTPTNTTKVKFALSVSEQELTVMVKMRLRVDVKSAKGRANSNRLLYVVRNMNMLFYCNVWIESLKQCDENGFMAVKLRLSIPNIFKEAYSYILQQIKGGNFDILGDRQGSVPARRLRPITNIMSKLLPFVVRCQQFQAINHCSLG